MADGSRATIDIPGTVPVAQILKTRQDFPNCTLSYEVQLESDGWRGLSSVALACEAAGLRLITLKGLANGTIFCALGDDGSADLELLAARLVCVSTMSGWTTLIQY